MVEQTAQQSKPVHPRTANGNTMTAVSRALEAQDIGRLIESKGVYFGTWTPVDRTGRSLGKIFDVFADVKDMTADNFNRQAERVSTLDGRAFGNSDEVIQAIADGSYNGERFIPTRELLRGLDAKGKFVQPDNLFTHRNRFSHKENPAGAVEPFMTHLVDGSTLSSTYLSCTECPDNPSKVFDATFYTEPLRQAASYDIYKNSCVLLRVRPVRAVPRTLHR